MLKTRTSTIQSNLLQSEQTLLFQSILDISDEAIFILDREDFTIIDCNMAALKLFEAHSKKQFANVQSFRLYNFEPFGFSIDKLNEELNKRGEYSQEMSFRTCKQNVFWGKLIQKNIGFSNLTYSVLKISKTANFLKDEEWLSEIFRSTSKAIGRQYFKKVTELLCQTFNGNSAFIARKINTHDNKVKIFYYHGETLQTNFIEIEQSFIENTLRGYISFYPNGIRGMFPKDMILKETNAESFMGAPLFANEGAPFGMIGVISPNAMDELPNSRYMLNILAARTSAEMQRIKSEEMLRQQTKKLTEINLIKDKILSVISNDLQAPLKNILSYSEMLSKKVENYNKREVGEKLKVMDSSLRNLHVLMENLSDWSNLQQGTVQAVNKENNLRAVLEEISPYTKYLSKLKSISFMNNIPEGYSFCADENLIRHTIKNIVSYVLRNTMKLGKVTLNVKETNTTKILSVNSEQHFSDVKEIDLILNSSLREIAMASDDINISAVGLFIAKEFAKIQNGSLKVNFNEQNLEFILEMPLLKKN